jgi:hypothetical protein
VADPAWVMAVGKAAPNGAENFITGGKFQYALAQVASKEIYGAFGFVSDDQVWLPFAVLGGMLIVQFFAILILLKRRDSV